jgi:glutamate-1-semialdehyde 2,1-aminomutase
VMTAMNEFLLRLDTPAVRHRYEDLERAWNARAAGLNERLAAEGVPVRVANLSTIWTVIYTQAGRYNWMLQFYLRAQGLALSWVGTGRFIFSLNYTEADFEAVAQKFLAAARAMKADGFWWSDPTLTNKSIKRKILREMLAERF